MPVQIACLCLRCGLVSADIIWKCHRQAFLMGSFFASGLSEIFLIGPCTSTGTQEEPGLTGIVSIC